MLKLGHEYECVIIFPSLLTPLLMLFIKTTNQLLKFTFRVCLFFLYKIFTLVAPLKTFTKHLLIKKNKINKFLCVTSSLNISPLPINETTQELSPHNGLSIWRSGLKEIHFYVLKIRHGEAFTLRPT